MWASPRTLLFLPLLLVCACNFGAEATADTDTTDTELPEDGPVHPVAAYPSLYDTDIPVDVILRVRFNEHLDARSVDADDMVLHSGPINKWLMSYYEPVTRSLLVWPSSPLRAFADWRFVLPDGIRGIDGSDVTSRELTRFTTGENAASRLPYVRRTYDEDVAPLLGSRCGACHDGSAGAFAGLDLSSAQGMAHTAVNRQSTQYQGWEKIRPYMPGRSYLLFKVLPGGYTAGRRMPRTLDGIAPAEPLTTDEQQVLSDWIVGGAIF